MSNQLHPAVLLFGTPGVGKGTQGKLLGKIVGFFHVSTGDIFRGLDPNSEEGKEVNEVISRGELVSNELTVKIWKTWLDAQIEGATFSPDSEVMLLDGIPRNVVQCEKLSSIIDVQRVIHLCSADEEEPIIERIKHRAMIDGRPDDADSNIIRRRFEIYRQQTSPVLDYYSDDIVHQIDPMGTPAEVLKRILERVIPVLQAVRGRDFDPHIEDVLQEEQGQEGAA
ncbi:MAG: adenylate kinase [Planctomycetaceae bacterium]|nr:adenylate kinase [Planctomycetaceae bacterium]